MTVTLEKSGTGLLGLAAWRRAGRVAQLRRLGGQSPRCRPGCQAGDHPARHSMAPPSDAARAARAGLASGGAAAASSQLAGVGGPSSRTTGMVLGRSSSSSAMSCLQGGQAGQAARGIEPSGSTAHSCSLPAGITLRVLPSRLLACLLPTLMMQPHTAQVSSRECEQNHVLFTNKTHGGASHCSGSYK